MGRYSPLTAAHRAACAGEEPKEKKPKEESRPWFDRAPGPASKPEVLFFARRRAADAQRVRTKLARLLADRHHQLFDRLMHLLVRERLVSGRVTEERRDGAIWANQYPLGCVGRWEDPTKHRHGV